MRMIIRAFLDSPIWFLERRFGVGLDGDTIPLGWISIFFLHLGTRIPKLLERANTFFTGILLQ